MEIYNSYLSKNGDVRFAIILEEIIVDRLIIPLCLIFDCGICKKLRYSNSLVYSYSNELLPVITSVINFNINEYSNLV